MRCFAALNVTIHENPSVSRRQKIRLRAPSETAHVNKQQIRALHLRSVAARLLRASYDQPPWYEPTGSKVRHPSSVRTDITIVGCSRAQGPRNYDHGLVRETAQFHLLVNKEPHSLAASYLREINQPRNPPTTTPSVKVAAIVSTG